MIDFFKNFVKQLGVWPKPLYYGGGGGGVGSKPAGLAGTAQRGGRPQTRNNLIYSAVQDLDSTDAIEVFEATATKGKGVMENPKSLDLTNVGDAAMIVTLQVPTWSDDTTQSGSTHLQMLLTPGQVFEMPTTKLIKAANANANTGTEVSVFTTPSSDLYVAAASTYLDGAIDDSTTSISVDNNAGSPATTAHMFRVGDCIRIANEIMRVQEIVVGSTEGTLTVERGMFGSGVASHSDNAVINYAFFNMSNDFDKFSTVCTNEKGTFQSSNFFGLGRATTIAGGGIIPGSVSFRFYSEPYKELGLNNIGSQTNSGLTKGSTYYFQIDPNAAGADEISFTVDAVTFGGSNGVLAKINSAMAANYYDSSKNLYQKRVSCGIVAGDIRFVFHERKSTSTIVVTLGLSGSDGTTNLFSGSTAIGRFPKLADHPNAVTTALPLEKLYDITTHEDRPNTPSLLRDSGTGMLSGPMGGGSINYDTGAFFIQSFADAEFQYNVSHSSGLAGRTSEDKGNIIEKIYAKSVSTKMNTRVQVRVFG